MAGVYDTCAQCGAAMNHPIGRGKARKYCGAVCQGQAEAARLAAKQLAPCSIDGCQDKANRVGAGLCEAHYMRERRRGQGRTERDPALIPLIAPHSGGYLLERSPGHPLQRQPSARVYQHRIVFHAHHGEGPFSCHWCGARVTWDDMHVDHLNDEKTDNGIDNLVASCPVCNQKRGAPKMRKAMKESGVMLTAHGKTMCVSDWARHLGLARATIMRRIANGMLLENALTSERGRSGPPRKREPIPGYTVDVTQRQMRISG